MEILAAFIVGLLLGVGLAAGAAYWLLQRTEKHNKEAQEAVEKHHQEAQEAVEKHYAEMIASEQARYQEALDKVSAQLKATTDEMLKQRQQELQQTNSTHMKQIVDPLGAITYPQSGTH